MFPTTASCQSRNPCSATDVTYPYKIAYLTNGSVAQIIFGCSEDQIGSFLDGVTLNGIFGFGTSGVRSYHFSKGKAITVGVY